MTNAISDSSQEEKKFNRYSIPLTWGIIIGIINCAVFTIGNMMFVGNMMSYFVFLIGSFIITMVLLCVAGAQQRKAMGGYIDFKTAFQAIFISILVIVVINFIYSQIYLHFIDPDFPLKMKDASLRWAEKMGASGDKLEEASKRADEQIANQKSISHQLFGLVWSIILYSIFGFICAAIVRKKKPETMA